MIDLKAVAQTILKRATAQRTKGGISINDQAYLEGELDTAQLFLKYIIQNESEQKEGEIQSMIKNELTFKRVRLEDIVAKDRGPSKFEAQIIELANDLRPGEAEQINPEKGMQYGNFNTRISKMRIAKKLTDDITTKKQGDAMFLARLPHGETVRKVTRRSQQQLQNNRS
jgi:hypothetical protein